MDQNNLNNELNNQNNNGLNEVNNLQQPVEQINNVQPVEPVQEAQSVQSTEPVLQVENNVQPIQQPVQNTIDNNQVVNQDNNKSNNTLIVVLIVLVVIFGGYFAVRTYIDFSTKQQSEETTTTVNNEINKYEVKSFLEEVTRVYTYSQNQYLTDKVSGTMSSVPKIDVTSTSGNSYTCYIYGMDDLLINSYSTSSGYNSTTLLCENNNPSNYGINIITTYSNSKYYLDGYINYTKNPPKEENVKKGEKSKDVVYVTSSTTESDYEKIKNSIVSLLD